MKFNGLNYRAARKYISEIFRLADQSDDPVSFLRDEIARNKRVGDVIRYAVEDDKNISSHIGSGIFPFKESPYQLGCGDFDVLTAYPRFYVLLNPLIAPEKRRQFFIHWIEGMHVSEAMCMISIKDQSIDLVYKNLTKEVLQKAIQ